MPFAITSPASGNWTFNSSVGQSLLHFDPVYSAQGSLSGTLYGFADSTVYYAVKVQISGFYTGPTGGFCTTSGSASVGSVVGLPAWSQGEGTVTREFVISLPAGGVLGSALNNQTFGITFTTSSGFESGRVFGWNSIVTGEPRMNVVGSTNPSDGGQTPPDPIKLSVTPTGTNVVLQGTAQTLNALCVSDGGVFYDGMNFILASITPGLGTFADNGGTSINRPNTPGTPAMPATVFNIAPGFVGLGQIKCENGYASNSPQYWTFDVKAPAVASGTGFLGILTCET